jgi:hypothetical protein
MNLKKIIKLVRGRKKEQLSSVLSHIVQNMRQLLARERPGYFIALCSLTKKAKNYLGMGRPRFGQKLSISSKIHFNKIQIQTLTKEETKC